MTNFNKYSVFLIPTPSAKDILQLIVRFLKHLKNIRVLIFRIRKNFFPQFYLHTISSTHHDM